MRLALLALVACSDPSPLDEVPDSQDEAMDWERIAAAADGLDPSYAHFVAAGDRERDETARIGELEEWAEAGGQPSGRTPSAPTGICSALCANRR